MSVSLIFKYSTGFSPALRTVIRPSLMCLPLQQCQHQGGEDLSTNLVMEISCTRHLAGPAAAAGAMSAGLSHAPAKGFDMNLILVLVVLRLALDSVQLEKHVHCHCRILREM